MSTIQSTIEGLNTVLARKPAPVPSVHRGALLGLLTLIVVLVALFSACRRPEPEQASQLGLSPVTAN